MTRTHEHIHPIFRDILSTIAPPATTACPQCGMDRRISTAPWANGVCDWCYLYGGAPEGADAGKERD